MLCCIVYRQEIFELMTPDAVRSLISQRPGNLQTLVTQAVAQLYQVVETVSVHCIALVTGVYAVMCHHFFLTRHCTYVTSN